MPRSPTVSYTYPYKHYGLTGNFSAPDNSGYHLTGSTATAAPNTFHTRGGHDFLQGFDGNDAMYSGGGNDIVEGGGGNDTISGDAGNDWLYGDYQTESPFAFGNDFIFGGDGADYLFGAGGIDQLIGGTGADVLEGGTGADLLTGGSGADFFHFVIDAESSSASAPRITDTITDFADGIDRIVLDFGTEAVTVFGKGVSASGDAVLVVNEIQIVLKGLSMANLTEVDIVII